MIKVPEEAAAVGSLQLKVQANLAGLSTGVDNHICPYFQILRYVEGAFEPMYRSKVVRNTDRPRFEDVHLPPHHVAHLVKEDVYIKVEVFDLESRGDPRCLGAIETSMSHLLADGKQHREKTGRSVAKWNGCHYLLGPQDTRKGELAKPVDVAPKRQPSIRIGALYEEDEPVKSSSPGGMTKPVKLAAPKEGMHKSGRRRLKPANALEAEGTASFGTFGEDERFLANLMMEQNIRETNLREVVDESLQYIDERRAHWLAETGKGSTDGRGSSSSAEKRRKSKGGRRGGDYIADGMGAVLDWGDAAQPRSPPLKTKRARAKEAARAKRYGHYAFFANAGMGDASAVTFLPDNHSKRTFCQHRVLVDRCRAELAARSAARKQEQSTNSEDTPDESSARFSDRQSALVPHTASFRATTEERLNKQAKVRNSQSMPELNRSNRGRSPSPRIGQDDNAASHGVLPRLNITQRWEMFDISARCATIHITLHFTVHHPLRLNRRQPGLSLASCHAVYSLRCSVLRALYPVILPPTVRWIMLQ